MSILIIAIKRPLTLYPYKVCIARFSRNTAKVIEYMKELVEYEDNHILVVKKPPNLLVHSDYTKDDNLFDLLKAYIKQKYNKPGDVYLGVVHRIDLQCSGLLVFAKTSKAASRLTNSFNEHDVHKKYIAVVQGEMLGSGELHHMLEIDAPSVKSVYGRKPGSPLQTKEAKLSYHVLGTLSSSGATAKTSVVDVLLKTGRKHQIRAQLAHIGHPIVNDVKYGYVPSTSTSSSQSVVGSESVPPIFLHAYLLSFPHPTTKQRLTFQAEVPSTWVQGDYSSKVIEALNKKIGQLVQEENAKQEKPQQQTPLVTVEDKTSEIK